MISSYIFLAILLSMLVTWIPRVLPFVLVKYRGLPPLVDRFLSYLPISIIFALILSSISKEASGQMPSIKLLDLLALIPTMYVGFRYRNLLATVIFGVILMACLRFFFPSVSL